MRIIEKIGIDFLHEGAREVLKNAGCDVRSNSATVPMDRAFVLETIAKAPSTISLKPRNPNRTITFVDI